MLNEVIEHLKPEQKERFIDGTVGQGGHAKAILAHALPGASLLGFDRDPRNLDTARERLVEFGDRVTLVNDSYANAKEHAYAFGFHKVDAILLDLGFASSQIDDPLRGFSFMHEGPLDMRFDPNQELTAETIVNEWSEDELAKIFRQYGEERNARQIAQHLIEARKQQRIMTTADLAELVASLIPRRGKIHPATKVFQALRIAVNDELGQLERALPVLVELLAPKGRLAIISFHSLEDRIVKKFFEKQKGKLKTITKGVVTPTEEEIKQNPRSRSSKLRVAEKQ